MIDGARGPISPALIRSRSSPASCTYGCSGESLSIFIRPQYELGLGQARPGQMRLAKVGCGRVGVGDQRRSGCRRERADAEIGRRTMTPENNYDDAVTLRALQADFPHLDISIEFL